MRRNRLKRFGVNLNQAAIEAKALELGIAGADDEITASVKAQAAYALIIEQTALAQGDFARTSDGLANQQRILTAEWENAKTEIGQGLLPVALELIDATRGNLIPAVTELATAVGPLLAQAFEVAAPFIGVTTQALEALIPAAEVVLDVIDAIPEPLLQLAALGYTVNKGIGLASGALTGLSAVAGQTALSVQGLAVSGRGVSSLTSRLSGVNLAAVGATAAIGAGLLAYDAATQSADRYDESVDRLTDSLVEAARRRAI